MTFFQPPTATGFVKSILFQLVKCVCGNVDTVIYMPTMPPPDLFTVLVNVHFCYTELYLFVQIPTVTEETESLYKN